MSSTSFQLDKKDSHKNERCKEREEMGTERVPKRMVEMALVPKIE